MSCSVYELGLAGGAGSSLLFLFSVSSNPLLSGSLNFSGSSAFLGILQNSQKLVNLTFHEITAKGLAADRSSGFENNCIRYTLFCIFIIIIVIIIISSNISSNSIYFVVMLNFLYLK